MHLTKRQKRNLELYSVYKSSPPNSWRLFRNNFKYYLVMLFLFILVVVLALAASIEPLAWGATGLLLGAILRDVGLYRAFVHSWPVTSAVIEWERVDELLAESSSL